jgi:hypothetical protein
MKLMAGLMRRGRDAREVMQVLDQAFEGVHGHDPCPCGSGRGFAGCHGRPQAGPGKRALPEPQARSAVTRQGPPGLQTSQE